MRSECLLLTGDRAVACRTKTALPRSRRVQHCRRSSLSVAPAIAPVILAAGGRSYGVLYAVAGV